MTNRERFYEAIDGNETFCEIKYGHVWAYRPNQRVVARDGKVIFHGHVSTYTDMLGVMVGFQSNGEETNKPLAEKK